MDEIQAVIGYWFAPGQQDRWFAADPGFDGEIRARFLPLVERAAAGELGAWAGSAEGSLALCLLLDQFPRNIWRGTARAFACDRLARDVARAALAAGHDRDLPPDRRPFLYLPFEHSEDLADQDRCVELMRQLGDPQMLDYAQRHRDIVARFGRFPHRNAILGRPSRAEETHFLQQPGSSF
jgi:uncharacterized protein (DUF924 family)